MAERLVTLDVSETTAIVRLNRPSRHNALVPELLVDLLGALNDERTHQARAVILTAEGRSFSTGGDLLEFWNHRNDIAEYAQHLVGLLNEVIISIRTHGSPIACAVQGQATGGSLGLLLAADRVIMQRDASITPWYAEIGFSPDGGWTALLPNVIGRQRALHWLCTNTSVTAGECLDMGIAHEVVSADVLIAAQAWSNRVARMNGTSIEHTRSLLSADTAGVRHRLEAERKAFVRQVRTPEAIAGIAKFLGKKTP